MRHPIVHGNIINHLNPIDYFGFPANSELKTNGALVMGAGAAKTFRDHFPGLDLQLGKEVSKITHHIHYHFISLKFKEYNIFALQTKISWKDISDLQLVKNSLTHLDVFATQHKHLKFHMPIPAIGLGGRVKEEIYPFLDALHLNNLILYEL
jgi:hypothetical protein